MKSLSGIFICMIGMWLCFSCSSPRIITYAHSTADFDRYKTFHIKPHQQVEALSRKGHETFQRLDTLIAGQLVARGYRVSQDPDLVIDYEISTGLSQDSPNTHYDRYPYSWYYPDYSYSAPAQEVEAMVEIHLVDTESKKTVWTGSADLTLNPRRDDSVERIQEHIIYILNEFEYSVPE